MALWQLDIVGGVFLADGTEAKVVTGVDDHSRYCVICQVVVRATGRAVCLAFAAALRRFGVPGEVLSDNGKQFTDRFGKGGEVLFDRICRDNGITHRLTQPRHPTTTGKIERFHGSLRRELLDDAVPFADLAAAQAAVDAWAEEYNTTRPHQGIGMVPQRNGSARHRPVRRRTCCHCGSRLSSPCLLPRQPAHRRCLLPSLRLSQRLQLGGSMRAARWSSSGWSRPAGTCRSPAASSGSARTAQA